jgi:hypothetical protein
MVMCENNGFWEFEISADKNSNFKNTLKFKF